MEFEPSFADGTLGVNWADVSYYAAPGLIVRAGYLVLPFGMYNKRLAAGWIDKLATDPSGFLICLHCQITDWNWKGDSRRER